MVHVSTSVGTYKKAGIITWVCHRVSYEHMWFLKIHPRLFGYSNGDSDFLGMPQ